MSLYAISDLHLALNVDKPMDVFGERWENHHEKIKSNWIRKVTDKDTVLIAGDISWAINIEEAISDLQWIQELPGRKIISKGNHDYWWSSIKKLNNMFHNIDFIQNNYFAYEGFAICGSRGWALSENEKDKKIYQRELIRMKLSLEEAKKNGYEKIIAMIHYPPTNEKCYDSEFIRLFKEYNVKKVIYGHLHGVHLKNLIEGSIGGIEYIMTSCDYLKFDPIKIM